MSTNQHLLNLKVLRLSKPTFQITSEIVDPSINPLIPIESDTSVDFLKELGISDLLAVPASFGNIYLGETFDSYLCVNNDSPTAVSDVSFKAELQTTSQRFTLADTIGTTPSNSSDKVNVQNQLEQVSLLPRQSTEFVLHHDIKELGIHILVCSVHYSPTVIAANDPEKRKFFRKFFKFQVLNPLAVKTKVNTLADGKICLEIQIQNLATVPLCLNAIKFECNDIFQTIDLNTEFEKTLQSQDTLQYLYQLVCKDEANSSNSRLVANLGRLEIFWSSTLGQPGHLQTAQLVRKVPSIPPYELIVLDQPNLAFVEKPFKLQLRIRNNLPGERQRLSITGNKTKMNQVVLSNINDYDVGPVDGQQWHDFELNFISLVSGLHKISGLIVSEKISGTTLEIDNLTSIRVVSN
ncbi:hypothetical protein BC833DRAFT_614574 [Globomyces pollinis-pini]|nr:hypothetical protein BC833DRAFT_614574 [Globomyces pollinis-pini]